MIHQKGFQWRKQVLFSLCLSLLCPAWFTANAQHIQPAGTDPLTISLTEREAYLRKGNLVPNPSFEKSASYQHDDRTGNFSVEGWKAIGKGVELTDIMHKPYQKDDAADGVHAIRITRTPEGVSEVEDHPEGVLSDYIAVIPGNYDFHLDVRLKNILPAIERWHSRVQDGIDIRLQYFDSDKKEINPGTYFKYLNNQVDNGFKGFAFSNFFYLDSLGWTNIKGRTWNYPFSEGDIPDNCQYIRIFLGLKCSGTLWVDNVSLNYSKWNFSPLERMDPFFHKNYDLSDLLIPQPQQIENRQHIDLKNKTIELVYAGPGSDEMNAAISLIREKFPPVRGHSVKLVSSISPSGKGKLEIVLINKELGEPAAFASAFRGIAGKEQGYFIRRDGNTLYLGANNARGIFYAATTLCQLIDDKNKELDYADITDFPDFTGRSSCLVTYQNNWSLMQAHLPDSTIKKDLAQREKNLQQQIRDIDFYAYYKINLLYSSYFILSKRWWLPGKFYEIYLREIGDKCKSYGDIIKPAVQFNPTFHFEMEQMADTLSDSVRNLFSYGSAESFERIIRVLKPALDAGAKTVMFCSDDFVPHLGKLRGEYVLFSDADRKQFVNLAEAQAFLLNKLDQWLQSHYGKIRLEFVPPQYNNLFVDYTRGSAETYFHDLMSHIPSDIVIVWTGNTIRSLSYDPVDIFRFTDLIKEKPMVWDNSPYARAVEVKNGGYPINYPEKSVLCDLFEPFDIEYPENFTSLIDDHYYSNNGGFGDINKIKYLSFADFAWNSKAYNPDFSLFKALVRYVGKENAWRLLKFNDAYYKFVSTWGAVNYRKDLQSGYHPKARWMDKANREIAALQTAFRDLKQIKNTSLLAELKITMDQKIDQWNKLIATLQKNK